jgi:hypothetical protein
MNFQNNYPKNLNQGSFSNDQQPQQYDNFQAYYDTNLEANDQENNFIDNSITNEQELPNNQYIDNLMLETIEIIADPNIHPNDLVGFISVIIHILFLFYLLRI